MMQSFLTLLQINDSMFPIGGFTQSYGLETYISIGKVKDPATARDYAINMLRYSVFYNDAAFVYRVYRDFSKTKNFKKWGELDTLVTALKAPMEIREASRKLGVRFLKTVQQFAPYPICDKYLAAIQSGKMVGHHSLAFGLYCVCAGVPQDQALNAFYYNILNGIVTNCAKAVPISQIEGQKILFDLQPLIQDLVAAQADMPEEHLGLCSVGQEVRCMQHEKLYTRIYIS